MAVKKLLPQLKKQLQNLILFITIVSVLNGAFFNRIGFRIADKPYFNVVVNVIVHTFFRKSLVADNVINYSKRFVPNNLPPNPGKLLDENSIVTLFCAFLLFYHLLLGRNFLAVLFSSNMNGELSDAYKMALIKPPV